jgi:hypothetical protein
MLVEHFHEPFNGFVAFCFGVFNSDGWHGV